MNLLLISLQIISIINELEERNNQATLNNIEVLSNKIKKGNLYRHQYTPLV